MVQQQISLQAPKYANRVRTSCGWQALCALPASLYAAVVQLQPICTGPLAVARAGSGADMICCTVGCAAAPRAKLRLLSQITTPPSSCAPGVWTPSLNRGVVLEALGRWELHGTQCHWRLERCDADLGNVEHLLRAAVSPAGLFQRGLTALCCLLLLGADVQRPCLALLVQQWRGAQQGSSFC